MPIKRSLMASLMNGTGAPEMFPPSFLAAFYKVSTIYPIFNCSGPLRAKDPLCECSRASAVAAATSSE